VAHFAGQQFMAFFGLLASGDVEKNPLHDPADDIRVAALAPRRNPPDLLADHDTEVDFVSADDCASG
jgi:hypothetical protein